MPNPSTGKGFKPVRMVNGQPYNGSVSAYKIASGYASAIAAGDPVKMTASGYLAVAAATDTVRGILVGIEYVGSDGIPVKRNNWIASTTTLASQDVTAFVVDDPNVLFEVRALNSAATLTQAVVGNTFNSFNIGSADSIGIGGAGIDATTLTGTNTVWRCLGFSDKADNDKASANPLMLVAPALHELRVNTGV